MKNIFTTCLLVFSIISFGQEAGKAGELLKNEASKSEMSQRNANSSKKKERSTIRDTGIIKTATTEGITIRVITGIRIMVTVMQKIFLRIPERGFYTVEVGDQMSANSSGKYRFFDIIPGLVPISVYANGYLLYRTRINVRNNSRLVLDFFSNRGLYLLGTYQLQNQTYGNYGDIWNDMWNSPYNNGDPGQWDPFYGTQNGSYGNNNNQGNYGNVMNSTMFNSFLQVVRKTNFDSDKVSVIKQQLRNTMVTSEQIKILIETLNYDKDRLDVAKYAYSRCADPNNYFVVYPSFQFQSSVQELRDYISRL
jgi:hypothetical protein